MVGVGLSPDGGFGEAALLIGSQLDGDIPEWQVDLLVVFGGPELAVDLVVPVERRLDPEASGEFMQFSLLVGVQAALRFNLAPECSRFLEETFAAAGVMLAVRIRLEGAPVLLPWREMGWAAHESTSGYRIARRGFNGKRRRGTCPHLARRLPLQSSAWRLPPGLEIQREANAPHPSFYSQLNQ